MFILCFVLNVGIAMVGAYAIFRLIDEPRVRRITIE